MNKKIALGQFYTPAFVAEPMVKIALDLLQSEPEYAIELAAGKGDLILELQKRIPVCKITAVDFDQDNTNYLKENIKYLDVYCQDSTKPLFFLKNQKFNLALGNPPFLSNIKIDESLKDLLKFYLDLDFKENDLVRAELVFICQYLSILSENGILAIILPESLISGHRFRKFREALFCKWQVEKIIEVPGNTFLFTEAKTHILFIRKASALSSTTIVSQISNEGEIISLKPISNYALKERMDFSYLEASSINLESRRLGDFATIRRGKKTHKYLKEQGLPYLHTTNIKSFSEQNIRSNKTLKGDIILCRVGTRVIGKSIIYDGETIDISDCLYQITFKDQIIKKEFFNYINSEVGLKKLKSLARGICSRYITISDLQNFMF